MYLLSFKSVFFTIDKNVKLQATCSVALDLIYERYVPFLICVSIYYLLNSKLQYRRSKSKIRYQTCKSKLPTHSKSIQFRA